MKAEATLQYMTDFYKSLFPTRKHCLNHLFCVIGNGYKWINGELVDTDDIYEKRYKLAIPIKHAEFPEEGTWWMINLIEKELSEQTNKPMNPNFKFSWSKPSKEYSYLYNYPDNIKPDWLQLLNECKQLLKEDNMEFIQEENRDT
ncbi:MAG: hypothetical protein NC548_62085 [Lachnospiraceae bacterium]|nr:hypothetical protein [Lachnospiraceae bacterium]